MNGILATTIATLFLSATVAGNIVFNCSVPIYKENLPAFSLGDRGQFPSDLLTGILRSAAPGVQLTQKTVNGSQYYYDGDRLVGLFDNSTGGTSVFPKLGSLKPASDISPGNISEFLIHPKIIPKDDTQAFAIVGSRLSGSQKTVDGTASPPATYLIESLIQRNIPLGNQAFPVYGPGTKASFSFGSDGSVKGLKYQWRSARNLGSTIAPISPDLVQRKIEAQLSEANFTTNLIINSVELCFFDSGKSFIQPVHRYTASVADLFGLSDYVIVGYVPAGEKELESLPSLKSPADQVNPTPPPRTPKRQSGSITVGRYAMSNDKYSPQIVVDENAFWNGLNFFSSRFINSQYYWDEPYMYESAAASYVNHVNIAFTEGHGDVHRFATNALEPGAGTVHISSDLPSTGFGPGAGGSLAYWIIRACKTISTPADYSAADRHKAFDPWYSVFNGMHAVMGYRTVAQVYDNEMGEVGLLLGLGASAVHGWMSAALGGGKTSAVTVCGHDDDTVFQIGNLGKPSCLQIWWYS